MCTLEKILSWNVNGLRALVSKLQEHPTFKSNHQGPQKYGQVLGKFFKFYNADIICFQETKCTSKRQMILEGYEYLIHVDGYESFWAFNTDPSKKVAYCGTTTWVRKGFTLSASIMPFGDDELDREGRVVMTKHPNFVLLNCYFPNSQQGTRIEYKMKFCVALQNIVQKLKQEGNSVIIVGDLNIVHSTIDSCLMQREKIESEETKQNKKTSEQQLKPTKVNDIWAEAKNKERQWLDEFLVQCEFIDTFRTQYPDVVKYSWWDSYTNARMSNIGCRIDYILMDKTNMNRLSTSHVHTEQHGSDHCPVAVGFKDWNAVQIKEISPLSSEYNRKITTNY
jgi:exodeoxyribonuclease-3